MAESETPAAPVVPEAPAAPAATKPTESLIDPGTPPATPPAAPAPADPPPAEWFLADGVKGNGAPPEWFKAGKYKNVEEQAKAYPHLEKRLGAFVGAPEGEYVVNLPDQYKNVVEVDTTNPVFGELSKWARDSQLSQAGYDQVIGLLAKYEASVYEPPPTIEDAKKAIGANADARLQSIGQFVGASLDADAQKALKAILSPSNPHIAETVAAVEALIAKSRQPAMPKPGDGGPPPPANELDEINKLQAQPDPKQPGKRLYETNQEHRHEVERRRREYFAKMTAAA